MLPKRLRATLSLCTLLVLAGSGGKFFGRDGDIIRPSKSLPATTPWNLVALSEPPDYEWSDRESSVRALYYQGEPYKDKPTRVFAYYASSASLHYTTGTVPVNKLDWESTPARIVNGQVISPAPPDEASVWFLTVTDNRGATVSSELVFAGEKGER